MRASGAKTVALQRGVLALSHEEEAERPDDEAQGPIRREVDIEEAELVARETWAMGPRPVSRAARHRARAPLGAWPQS